MWDKIKEAFQDDGDDKKRYQQNYDYAAPAASNYSASLSYESRLASMSLHSNDCIRFLNLPQQIIDRCRQVVQREWASNDGIGREREYAGSWEFDLHGSPWGSNGKGDATAVRRMLCGLLRTLHSEGWMLALCTDISRKNYDKDMIILRQQGRPQGEFDWGCVSFSSSEKLRFIDFPPEVHENTITRLASIIPVEKHSQILPGVYEYRFEGYPWEAEGRETMEARRLVLALMDGLEAQGWTVYASLGHKSSESEYTSDTHTWYCCRPRGPRAPYGSYN